LRDAKEFPLYAFLFRCHHPHTFGDETCLVVVGGRPVKPKNLNTGIPLEPINLYNPYTLTRLSARKLGQVEGRTGTNAVYKFMPILESIKPGKLSCGGKLESIEDNRLRRSQIFVPQTT
jgi:hypothetical protein